MNIPIVLLPGILGSRLYFENSGLFWDPDDTWRMLKWMPVWPFRSDDDNRMDLHAQEPAAVIQDLANVNQAQSDRGWSGVAWTYYGPMLQSLDQKWGTSNGIYSIGYDWRQDISALADYAAEKIDEILAKTGAQQVAVITHSMGGLVIRAALRKGAIIPKIAVVLHICMPASGAVVIYRRMFTGLVETFDGGGSISDRAFRFLLGDSRKGFVGNFSGLPGAVQLMPGSYFPFDTSMPPSPWNPLLSTTPYNQLYFSPASPPGIVPDNIGLASDVVSDLNDRVADLYDFQAFFGNPADQLHPQTYLIYGSAATPLTIPLTDTHIGFDNGDAIPIQDTLGDGTVPVLSAKSLQLDPTRMIPLNVEHSMACADAAVQAQAATILGPYL
jgi:pimeloyl-ACP methyl ester carboxylesterase